MSSLRSKTADGLDVLEFQINPIQLDSFKVFPFPALFVGAQITA